MRTTQIGPAEAVWPYVHLEPALHDCAMTIEKTVARDAIRVFNKHLLNPAILRLAGRRHFYASAIRHTGRRTGKPYVTPVVATRVTDGFVIPLPYGSHTDWLCNLEVAPKASLRFHGETFPVTSPVVIDAAAATAELRPDQRRMFKRLGIRQFVHLTPADPADPTPGADDESLAR